MNEKNIHSLALRDIKIDDSFWNRYINLVPDVIIPYQWEILNDRVPDAAPSYCLQNFKIAAGETKGERKGAVFQDSDVAKWLETVAYSLETTPNPRLEETADEVIALLGRAQCEDGYLNTYFTLKEPGRRWTNLAEGHELYTAGHLIEAAVAYYKATGKKSFLQIMCRFADLICSTFGEEEGKIHGYPGHQEIELAMVKLYDATKTKKYLKMAKYFIDTRGSHPNYFLTEMSRPDYQHIFDEFKNYDPVYSQSDKPVREQKEAEGHAVRAVYLYCAMADLADEYEDAQLLKCCDDIWRNIVNKKMYLTGGIGSSAHFERFTTDYDLPNDSAYSETCASVGLTFFGLRMARIHRDASYMDTVERALYNTVRAGISREGNRYFYVNPLAVWPDNCMDHTSMSHVKPTRQKWFDVACCPTNVARTLASLGQYIYFCSVREIYVNLFIQNETAVVIDGKNISLHLMTDFPRTSKITLEVQADGEIEFSIFIRIPQYAQNFGIAIADEVIPFLTVNHYAVIKRSWKHENITISFDMQAKLVSANPQVRADGNKVAIVRGPEVFCLEECDNFKNLSSVIVSRNTVLEEYFDSGLLGGTTVVTCQAQRISESDWNGELYRTAPPQYDNVTLRAVPYSSWCNRVPGEMLVWMNAKI